MSQGIARFRTRDGQIIGVHPGEAFYTPPGQDHWHAAGDTFMAHIAMLENADDTTEITAWKERISDEECSGRDDRALPSGRERSLGFGSAPLDM